MAEFITEADIRNQFRQLNASNGYTILPNNICLEWGSVSVSSGSQQVSITLPIKLSLAFNAVVCVQHQYNEGAYVAYVRSVSTTTLTLYKYGSAANTLRWFVVGLV